MRFNLPLRVSLAAILVLGLQCKSPKESETKAKSTTAKTAAAATAKTAQAKPAVTKPQLKRTEEIIVWDSVAEVDAACAAHLKKAEGLKAQILSAKEGRSLENTLQPLNEILIQMDRIMPRSELIANVHPRKEVRLAAEACEKKAKKFLSTLMLDRTLFEALKDVKSDALDVQAKRFQTHLLRDYRRSGVDRDEATRAKLATLDAEIVELGQSFTRNIREDKRYIEVTEKELEGLPEDFLASHRKKGLDKIRITTDYPDFFPVQSYAKNESVRKALYKEYLTRAFPKNEAVLKAILEKRHQYATTLGYPDFGEYNAEDKMVKNRKVVADFIAKVTKLARPRMKSDLKKILARKKKDDRRAKIVGSWDRFYYVKRIKAENFGVDPAEVRSYFEFAQVKKGILDLAQELFGVTFKRVAEAKVWHPSVEAYDVFEGDKQIARFYLDLHPRDGKYGHAAEFPIFSGVEGKQMPVASLVTNFPNPSKSQGPALTEHHQVITFFHEFGHLMHQLLASNKRWVTQAGITCEWDFVEAPSQILEEWAWDAKVLSRFAKHHKTGEVIPAALVEKMRKAKAFGKGVHVMRQMFYAALSYAYHSADPSKVKLMKTLKKVQKVYSPYPHHQGTAVYANFGHLYGYSSMYYTYMWSLVLAKDLFTRFAKDGLLNKETALAYRKAVLAPGGTVDAADMVKDFLGRPYSFAAYESWLKQD